MKGPEIILRDSAVIGSNISNVKFQLPGADWNDNAPTF